MTRNQVALKEVAEYLRDNCEPITRSVDKVRIVHEDTHRFVVEFRSQDYYDYYNEDEDSHLYFSEDLAFRLGATVDTLPDKYKHPGLNVFGEVGEKGYCSAVVYLQV